jgi:hypothetical protein
MTRLSREPLLHLEEDVKSDPRIQAILKTGQDSDPFPFMLKDLSVSSETSLPHDLTDSSLIFRPERPMFIEPPIQTRPFYRWPKKEFDS